MNEICNHVVLDSVFAKYPQWIYSKKKQEKKGKMFPNEFGQMY